MSARVHQASPTEFSLLFEVDPEPLPEVLTALGGVPLAFRSLGLPGLVKEHVRIKERQRGYDEATWGRMESCGGLETRLERRLPTGAPACQAAPQRNTFSRSNP